MKYFEKIAVGPVINITKDTSHWNTQEAVVIGGNHNQEPIFIVNDAVNGAGNGAGYHDQGDNIVAIWD